VRRSANSGGPARVRNATEAIDKDENCAAGHAWPPSAPVTPSHMTMKACPRSTRGLPPTLPQGATLSRGTGALSGKQPHWAKSS
jgi:hypothetical protein